MRIPKPPPFCRAARAEPLGGCPGAGAACVLSLSYLARDRCAARRSVSRLVTLKPWGLGWACCSPAVSRPLRPALCPRAQPCLCVRIGFLGQLCASCPSLQ